MTKYGKLWPFVHRYANEEDEEIVLLYLKAQSEILGWKDAMKNSSI